MPERLFSQEQAAGLPSVSLPINDEAVEHFSGEQIRQGLYTLRYTGLICAIAPGIL